MHRSHQRWLWRHDILNDILYRDNGPVYIRYVPIGSSVLRTRQGGKWHKWISVVTPVKGPLIRICTVLRHTTNNALLYSTSYSPRTPLPSMVLTHNSHTYHDAPYQSMIVYSDHDDGGAFHRRLLHQLSRLVGDGSYDPLTHVGSAAIIWENVDLSTRLSNAVLVPSNPPTLHCNGTIPIEVNCLLYYLVCTQYITWSRSIMQPTNLLLALFIMIVL